MVGRQLRHFGRTFSALLLADVLIIACSPATPAPPVPTNSWGTITPVVSVKELMRDLIDPIADNIFDSVKVIVDQRGTTETKPTTDEDWDRLRIGAVTMIEASQLLLVRRPWAPDGDENDSKGPDAPELSPAQIEAKVAKDPVLWQAKVQALRNVGLEVLDIIKRKDVQELWDAGENLDVACENCHIEYWYPGDIGLLRRLDQRLEQLHGPRAPRNPTGVQQK